MSMSVAEPAEPPTIDRAGYGSRGRDDPFVVLPAEQAPPAGIQAAEGLWALVTIDGAPVAFVSPEVVSELDPYRPVGTLFDGFGPAYVAQFAREPRRFFEAELGEPVSGRVLVLDNDFADTLGRGVPLSDFVATKCLYGQILPVGTKCDKCVCQRDDA